MNDFKRILNDWGGGHELLQKQIDGCVKEGEWTVIKTIFTQTAANTLEYTGVTIHVPLGKVAMITVINQYNNSKPVKVALMRSGTTSDNISEAHRTYASGCLTCSMIYSPINSAASDVEVWTSHALANANDLMVKYKFI